MNLLSFVEQTTPLEDQSHVVWFPFAGSVVSDDGTVWNVLVRSGRVALVMHLPTNHAAFVRIDDSCLENVPASQPFTRWLGYDAPRDEHEASVFCDVVSHLLGFELDCATASPAIGVAVSVAAELHRNFYSLAGMSGERGLFESP